MATLPAPAEDMRCASTQSIAPSTCSVAGTARRISTTSGCTTSRRTTGTWSITLRQEIEMDQVLGHATGWYSTRSLVVSTCLVNWTMLKVLRVRGCRQMYSRHASTRPLRRVLREARLHRHLCIAQSSSDTTQEYSMPGSGICCQWTQVYGSIITFGGRSASKFFDRHRVDLPSYLITKCASTQRHR